MHRHNLHGAGRESPGLAFPRGHVAKFADVGDKGLHADDPAGVGIRQQLADVVGGSVLASVEQDGAVRRAVQESLQHLSDLCTSNPLVQLLDQHSGLLGPFGFLLEHTQILAAKRLPQRCLLHIALQVPQPVERHIGEPHRGRSEQARQRQVIGGIGQSRESVQKIAHLGAIVETAARDGQVRNPSCLQGVLVGGE